MTPAGRLILCLGLAVAPVPAAADGFFTRDLGEGGSPSDCLDRASRTVETYFHQRGVSDGLVQTGDWSVQGYDLPPGDVQVQIACPWRDDVVSIVLLFSYSLGPPSDRETVVNGLDAIWQQSDRAPLRK